MAADINTAVQHCVRFAKCCVHSRMQTSSLKLLPVIEPLEEPLESVAFKILESLPKSLCWFQYIIVIAHRLTNLVQVVPLKLVCLMEVSHVFLKHWVQKYGPRKTIILDNDTPFTSKLFHRVCWLLETANEFSSTYHQQTNGYIERYN